MVAPLRLGVRFLPPLCVSVEFACPPCILMFPLRALVSVQGNVPDKA